MQSSSLGKSQGHADHHRICAVMLLTFGRHAIDFPLLAFSQDYSELPFAHFQDALVPTDRR